MNKSVKRFLYFLLGFCPLILSFLLQFPASVLIMFVIMLKDPSASDSAALTETLLQPSTNGTLGIILSLLCILFFSIWYYQTCGGNYLPNPKKTFNLQTVTGTILLAPGFQFACSIVMMILTVLMPEAIKAYEALMEEVGMTGETSIFLIIYAVLLAPISEELIFRGVTMRCFRRAVPFWFANIMQAALFGLFHANLVQGIYTFVFALALGYLCERGGSIYYSILAHFVFNLWGTIIQQAIIDISEVLYLFVFGGCFFLLILGGFLFYHGRKKLDAKAFL